MLGPASSLTFPEHLSGDNGRHLAEGTWRPRAVQSSRTELEGTAKAPWQARRAVDFHLGGVLEEQGTADLRLLTSELVTNALLHGKASSGMVMYLAASADCVRVEVCDGGTGFNVSGELRAADALGGRGLPLLELLASRWGVAGDDGTCVWFEQDLVDDPR